MTEKEKRFIPRRLEQIVLRSFMSLIRRCRYRSFVCRYLRYSLLSLLPLIYAVIIFYLTQNARESGAPFLLRPSRPAG